LCLCVFNAMTAGLQLVQRSSGSDSNEGSGDIKVKKEGKMAN